MPHLRAVPATAVGALDPAGENADAAPAVGAWTPCHHKGLYHLEGFPVDDGFVVVSYIVLRDLALVNLFLLCEEVDRVGLLKESVALVDAGVFPFGVLLDKGAVVADLGGE